MRKGWAISGSIGLHLSALLSVPMKPLVMSQERFSHPHHVAPKDVGRLRIQVLSPRRVAVPAVVSESRTKRPAAASEVITSTQTDQSLVKDNASFEADLAARPGVELPQPIYPRHSMNRGEEGTVELCLTIDQSQVASVAVCQSSGFPRLDIAALRAYTGWSDHMLRSFDRRTIRQRVVFRLCRGESNARGCA